MKRAFSKLLHLRFNASGSLGHWHYLEPDALMAKLAFFFIPEEADGDFMVCLAKSMVGIPLRFAAELNDPMVPRLSIESMAPCINFPANGSVPFSTRLPSTCNLNGM